ncbi:hypothetical protein JOF28_002569 [Leucobacter exalbidus]|uniref:DUF4190 domain-containing protein n=1 Tax=Leucobacter exalbidus TaxID=662960 RepID=A0A940PNQ1_9MICO|nr:DUF4190 domain-containing protein [Leucobacter exalbidus]MBP1327337.1 hypothetical protein [Leucobacter exalbidus]
MTDNLPPNQPENPELADLVAGAAPAYRGEAAPVQPGYAAAPPVAGKTLGIVGLVLAILIPIVGLILSIVAFIQSKKAGARNIPGLIGIILGALGTIVYILIIVFIVQAGLKGVEIMEVCAADPTASVEYLGQVLPCSALTDEQLTGF